MQKSNKNGKPLTAKKLELEPDLMSSSKNVESWAEAWLVRVTLAVLAPIATVSSNEAQPLSFKWSSSLVNCFSCIQVQGVTCIKFGPVCRFYSTLDDQSADIDVALSKSW